MNIQENKKPKRRRDNQIIFRLNDDEKKQLNEKANAVGLSKESYIRKMCLEGKIIFQDLSTLNSMIFEIHKIGVNINQIAHRINETNIIYKNDLEFIKSNQKEIYMLLRESLMKLK